MVRYHLLVDELAEAERVGAEGVAQALRISRERDDAPSHFEAAEMLFLTGAPLEQVEDSLAKATSKSAEPDLKEQAGYLQEEIEMRKRKGDRKVGGFRFITR